jgi:hypothetical protein
MTNTTGNTIVSHLNIRLLITHRQHIHILIRSLINIQSLDLIIVFTNSINQMKYAIIVSAILKIIAF